MEFNVTTTVVAFAAIVAIGVGGMIASPVGMSTDTILTMVLPSMAIFGALALALGVKHGEYRAGPR